MLVKANARGIVRLPRELCEGLPDDALFEAADGVIELRPQVAVDAAQQWFWTGRWQRMEREAEADIAAGRFETFDDAEQFLTALEP